MWAAKIIELHLVRVTRFWRRTDRVLRPHGEMILAETDVGSEDNVALVFKVVLTTAIGFGKEAVFSQTRWRFS